MTTSTTTGIARGVTGATRAANVVTITTATAHTFNLGEQVLVQNLPDNSFNGTYTIASMPTSTTFTYARNGVNQTLTPGESAVAGVNRTVTTTTTTSYALSPSTSAPTTRPPTQ